MYGSISLKGKWTLHVFYEILNTEVYSYLLLDMRPKWDKSIKFHCRWTMLKWIGQSMHWYSKRK